MSNNVLRVSFVATLLAIPGIVCAQPAVSVNVPIVQLPGDQTEPSIAADPTNPNRLVAVMIDGDDCRVSYTSDRGASWTLGAALDKTTYAQCTDPSVAFDREGGAHFAGVLTNKQCLSNACDSRIAVVMSSAPAGESLQAPVLIDGGFAGSPWVDKPSIAVDSSGPASSHNGTVYVAWNTFYPTADPNVCDDHGTCPRYVKVAAIVGGVAIAIRDLSEQLAVNDFGAVPAVGPAGEVYVVWRRFNSGRVRSLAPFIITDWVQDDALFSATSTDGGNTWGLGSIASVTRIATLNPQAAVVGTVTATRYPVVAVSPAGGTKGTVYVAFSDQQPRSAMVDVPGMAAGFAPSTRPAAINVSGSIVGEYFAQQNETTFQNQGFLLLPSRVVNTDNLVHRSDRAIAVRQGFNTSAAGLNDLNQIVGWFDDETGEHGFLLDGNAFSTAVGFPPVRVIDGPVATVTRANGINNHGQIAGGFIDQNGNGAHGFLWKDGTFATFDYPNARYTEAFGINDDGAIVGCYYDAGGPQHAFHRSATGALTNIDYPGAATSCAKGINNAGRIVGSYDTVTNTVGFVREPDGTASAFTATVPDDFDLLATSLTGISNANELAGIVVARNRATNVTGPHGFTAPLDSSQEIFVTRSDNGSGTSWTAPVRVNDDTPRDQIDPWLCVAPDGRIHVAWLDRRNDPLNILYDTFYAMSSDGAQTFSRNIRLTSMPSDPRRAGLMRNGKFFIGDYIGVACRGAEGATAVWPDMRDGDQNVYGANASCGLTGDGAGTVSDTCTGLMWLGDANRARSDGFDPDGAMPWSNAMAWADALVAAGYNDWRLPNARFPDLNCRPGATPFIGVNCVGSELGHLYYSRGIQLSNPGPFTNIASRGWYYWSRSEFDPSRSWLTRMDSGEMGAGNKSAEAIVWAVRDIQPTDTSIGPNVSVTPHPDVTVTFTQVAAGGATSVTVSDINPGPATFTFIGRFYDITSAVTYTPPITICITYSDGDVPSGTAETDLRLRHLEGGTWVDVTTSIDTATDVVCGSVASLSWFGIALPTRYRAAIQPPIASNGSSVFKANRGAVPVKFTLTRDDAATCQLQPATISVFRTSAGTPVGISQSEFVLQADRGSNFRIDSSNCQYVFNLASNSLGPGGYLVQISIGDVIVGSGTFGLK